MKRCCSGFRSGGMCCCAHPERRRRSPTWTGRRRSRALAGKLSLAEARRLVEAAEGAIDKLERNVNPRLLAEVLLLDWPKP